MKIRIDTTLERDMDLLIIEEFIANKDFASIFLNRVGISDDYTIDEVIHSKRDAEFGESDIVLILNVNGKRHALHIEDKVDAMAMPNQHGRYDKRAAKDVSRGQYDSYSVLMVAPAKYLNSNKEALKYPHKVTYEELVEHFNKQSGVRYMYKVALIERAITEQKNGYQYEADSRMVAFCKAMAVYQQENVPRLPKLSTAWWPICITPAKGASIVFKANKGHCDLQFRQTTVEQLYPRVQNLITNRMHVVKARKSASVRIEVKPIDFEKPFLQFENEVNEALQALLELYDLSASLIENDDS